MPIYQVRRERCTESELIEAICPRSAVIEFMHTEVQEGCMPPEVVIVSWSGGEETYEFKKKEQACQNNKPQQRSLFQRLFVRQ